MNKSLSLGLLLVMLTFTCATNNDSKIKVNEKPKVESRDEDTDDDNGDELIVESNNVTNEEDKEEDTNSGGKVDGFTLDEKEKNQS